MPVLYSYVVAYDSGFAPNPFGGYCTLATCKPDIRKRALIGDWVIGTGSDRRDVRRGGFLVYAMRVQETLTFVEYWSDERFQGKKPSLNGSYRMACGDNIYYKDNDGGRWGQLNSYHSNEDGTPYEKHVCRDTSVNRVLVSTEYIYFGTEGPKVPEGLQNGGIVHVGRGTKKIDDENLISSFISWFESLSILGYAGMPFDMFFGNGRKR